MSAKEQGDIMAVAFVCGMFVWMPLEFLLSGGSLPLSMIVSNALGVLDLWAFMFFFVLIMRDTLRQSGRWAIDLKLPVCSQCGCLLQTKSFRIWLQRKWGCWTCHVCGFEMTKWGRPVKERKSLARWAVLRALGNADERERRRQCRDGRIQKGNDQTQRGDLG